ncbi:V-type ATP synthase subunit K [Solibaculum mannosilyticum]|uniref:V-type ATP synthase subunit K n=1 Tax=Solibaculum mannosilyticum TaxID=2780922 RepID=A0A7I8CYN6_9FIRM|nr:V-type ATP synthase subunit K [Solibaculum mannosilyticum]MCO7137143.1 V-type ATP synthase subunit K [[Clostridium] leptum]BCI59496.1 V-type ATP synthase subunit K [Solibaculum mannosilyticum]CZT55277.1 V-type sodium ATPase subunit K [Eubacteriaceae bacterium CHKCI005]
MIDMLGLFFALAGSAIAVILAGIGSAKGVGMVAEASAGVVVEDASKFTKLLILQVLPGTQGLYGFVVSIMILLNLNAEMSFLTGLLYFIAALPIAFGGLFSAIAQARVATSGVNIIAKKPNESGKAITSAALVEFYALLSFIISILAVVNIPGYGV